MVAAAGSVISSISSKSVQVLSHLSAGSELGKLPQVEDLQAVLEFHAPAALQEKATAAASKSGATSLLSLLSAESAEKEAPRAPCPFSVGSGLPTIPRKTAEKIWAGEYIDFSDLPPARGKAKSLPSAMEGHIIVVQAADLALSRKLIPDMATWIQCFALYAAVITVKEPGRAGDLFAYMSTIAKASLKYKWPSWIVYDQNFRQEAADKGLKNWAQVDPSIYTQCFTGMTITQEGWCKICLSIDHSSESCSLKQARKRPAVTPIATSSKRAQYEPNLKPQVCIKYNKYEGDCKFGKACRYQHVCSSCGGGHPATKCTLPKSAEP